jgi:hypothetical protein
MKLPRWLSPDRSSASARTPLNAAGADAQRDTIDPLAQVRWIPAAENPFSVDVLDCSLFAASMVAMTSSAEVARRFTELRESRGEHCHGTDPNAVAFACHLEYPSESHVDGPVFRAAQMEDKWDVFLLGGSLYFARSWTGEVAYRARVAFVNSLAIVSEIRSEREPSGAEDPRAVVDYLIKSHVFGLVAPHPLPDADRSHTRDLAQWSFGRYGRRGVCGTMEDVTHLAVRRNDDGRCTLSRPV